MRKLGLLALLGMVPVWAGEMPEKAADYHAALVKRPESAALFDRFRDAWLEERSVEDLERELLARAEAKEAGAWATLARAHLAAGKSDQALEAFDKAREQAPVAWLDLETAKLRMAAKDFAAAEKDALAVADGDPMRLEAVKLAGLACLRAERIEDALAHWTKAVAAAPGDIGLLEDLTELTRREGRFDLALEYCGKWRDATTDAYGKAMATLRRAELLLASQRFDEALTELAAVLAVSADDSWLERETLARAEQAHRQRGDSTGWAKWIGAQAEANPSRLNFRRTHSQALAAAGKTDEALEVLTEVMKRSPGEIAVRWQRIGLLEQSMKLSQAYEECAELAAKEKSETAGLRLAELAFRLEKKDELKRALDGVLAAADPAKRVGLAGLYARYGLPEGSERIWREEAGGEQGGQALRQLAKHLKTAGRDKDAIDVWKQLGARDVAQDRMEAAQMLAAAGERGAAREILMAGREKFSAEAGYEAALADLAVSDEKTDEARAIYLKLARAAKRPDELTAAAKGWLRTSAAMPDPLKDLGEETPDRCLRAAWLAAAEKPLPPVRDGDELERLVRQALLREQGRWPEVVAMMEAAPGERGPLFLSELAEAKTAAGDLPGALATTQEWRGRVPDQAGPWLFEAGTLEKLGRQADATVLLRRAAARFEDNEDVARRLFSILQQSSDPREALEWAWKRHDRSENESVRTSWLREILQVSKQREQLEDLQARFEERARRDPASPGPLMALAELAKARGDSQAELDFLRRAAVNAPRDLAVISALAKLEEQSGETARALERHTALARLAPGPDSARNLAQAKIRLGDIEGGMRDMQALAGEKGIDLRALEQSAGDLASRGYVEEAIRLLAAVEPAQRTARLDFVLGSLLDTDGREKEAVDAFLRVMTEPDDPAENQRRAEYGYDSRGQRQYSQILQSYGGREERFPGNFSGLQVPQSLVEAKTTVRSRLAWLAMQQGGESWTKAAAAIPELAVATPEQWREAMDFSQSGADGHGIKWWDFIDSHPTNPLGLELLVESGQAPQARPDQVEALLKTHPSPRVQMQLRSGGTVWRADNLAFFESIDPAFWQDDLLRRQALWLVQRMFYLAFEETSKTPVTLGECARALAVLEKAGLGEQEALALELLKSNFALMKDNTGDFVKHLNSWSEAAGKLAPQQWGYFESVPPVAAFARWRKKAGEAAAEAVIARIDLPFLRCQFAADPTPELRIARVNRELAALPKDAPADTRRALVRLSWSYRMRGSAIDSAMRKELETVAADESDLRLAFEAQMQLTQRASEGRRQTAADRMKTQTLLRKLAASPDPADQAYAAQYDGYFGGPQRQPALVVTRWGAANSFSSGGSSRNLLALPAIIAMEDREQAAREAARLLESTARAHAGHPENLRNEIKSLSDADLLENALARISLPPAAGLGRQVAMLTLLDACSKTDRARELLAEIAKSRPWETRWTADLALRTPDDAEMHRLLDSLAGRGDFDRILMELIAPQSREVPAVLSRLKRLADWAPQAKGHRTWMGPALVLLANGGNGGMQALTEKDSNQIECYRQFLKLALDNRWLAEAGFRVMFATRRLETPEALTEAARRALVAGAYTSDERSWIRSTNRELVAPSALEHLVQVAAEKGDEAAFPADFRESLKTADPASEEWLAKLLAAKKVSELPDLVIDPARQSAGWVALARHEAAMLRAVSLPGRDAWLLGIFREKKYQSQSENLRSAIRACLRDAEKKKAMPERLLALLEAAVGPRKDWNKKPQANQPYSESGPVSAHLQQAASVILNAASEDDPPMLLAVLDFFRESRVPVQDMSSVFSRLAKGLRAEGQPQGMPKLAEIFGSKRDAIYTFGHWQFMGGAGGAAIFQWGLPPFLRNYRSDDRQAMVKAVKADPNAAFPDLLQAWVATSDKSLQRRALLKAAPDLAKLPAEIRRAVIDTLTAGMGSGEMEGLSVLIMDQLRGRLEIERKQRVESTRQNFEAMQLGTAGLANQSSEIGSLLGRVITDDDALVAEILAAWRPIAEADRSGREIDAFVSGIISYARQDARTTMAVLRLLDSLWKGSPPPSQRSSGRGDLMENIWSRMDPQALRDPEFWRQCATLSPKLQARFWAAGSQNSDREFGADPKLMARLREAAKGSEITRTALVRRLQAAAMQGDSQSKIDEKILLDFAKALKTAGAPVESIAQLVCRAFPQLYRMQNPGVFMAETPTLLDGLKTFPEDEAGTLFQGLQNLWQKILRERRETDAARSESALPAPVYPVETVALLKFVFARKVDPSRFSFDVSGMTSIIIATDDAELLDLLFRISRKSLIGDFKMIFALLEKNRIAEAIALTPDANDYRPALDTYTARMESLISKIRPDSSPQAFRLTASFALGPDAILEDAPTEKYAARRERLATAFDVVRKDMGLEERARMCIDLNFPFLAISTHVPALDEFASGPAEQAFAAIFESKQQGSFLPELYVPAVCSRAHSGDLSGINRLTAMITTAGTKENRASRLARSVFREVQACLIIHMNRLDGKLPEPLEQAVCAFAKAITADSSEEVRCAASQLIYFASKDPAALEAALKSCGLEGVKPDAMIDRYRGRLGDDPAYRGILRLTLLHPFASQTLDEAIGTPIPAPTEREILELLEYERMRAIITPELFLHWHRNLRSANPRDVRNIELYVKERRNDFDSKLLPILDSLLKKLHDPLPSNVHEAPAGKDAHPARLQKTRGQEIKE